MKKLHKSLICISVMLLLCLLFSVTSVAEETGKIDLHCKAEDTPLVGETYALVKIADADVHTDAKNMSFTIVDKFAQFDRDWSYTSASELQDLSYQIRDYVLENNIKRTRKMTDNNGDITWTGLEPGIYLIFREKTRNPEYSGAPIILTVPQIMNKEIKYDVSVLPKFSKGDQGNDGEIDTDWESTGPELDTGTGGHPGGGDNKAHSPGTGDETVILPFVFVAAIGVFGIAVTEKRRHSKNFR